MHWVTGNAVNLPSLSFSDCSQTSCNYGTGFAERKESFHRDRRPSKHSMRDSPCPKDELALWLDRRKGPMLQPSSITNR